MSVPTPDEIADAAAEVAEIGVQSVTTDGQTTVAMDPEKALRVADKLAARAKATAGNGNRSGWRHMRAARYIPPSAAGGGGGDC